MMISVLMRIYPLISGVAAKFYVISHWKIGTFWLMGIHQSSQMHKQMIETRYFYFSFYKLDYSCLFWVIFLSCCWGCFSFWPLPTSIDSLYVANPRAFLAGGSGMHECALLCFDSLCSKDCLLLSLSLPLLFMDALSFWVSRRFQAQCVAGAHKHSVAYSYVLFHFHPTHLCINTVSHFGFSSLQYLFIFITIGGLFTALARSVTMSYSNHSMGSGLFLFLLPFQIFSSQLCMWFCYY